MLLRSLLICCLLWFTLKLLLFFLFPYLLYSLCSLATDADDVIQNSDKNYFIIYIQHVELFNLTWVIRLSHLLSFPLPSHTTKMLLEITCEPVNANQIWLTLYINWFVECLPCRHFVHSVVIIGKIVSFACLLHYIESWACKEV